MVVGNSTTYYIGVLDAATHSLPVRTTAGDATASNVQPIHRLHIILS